VPSATSTRVWLTCGLLTAAAVAAALSLKNRPEADGPAGPPAPPPLTEPEIRTYLLLAPTVDKMRREIAYQYQISRRPGQPDDPALGEQARARLDALLQGQHLTQKDYFAMSQRVERVVNLIRAEAEFPEARPGIVQRLEMKKSLLKSLPANDPQLGSVEREIRDTEALLANGPEKVSAADRELALRYWASLDPIVPKIGPPPNR
jgi:hypothetical protein